MEHPQWSTIIDLLLLHFTETNTSMIINCPKNCGLTTNLNNKKRH